MYSRPYCLQATSPAHHELTDRAVIGTLHATGILLALTLSKLLCVQISKKDGNICFEWAVIFN